MKTDFGGLLSLLLTGMKANRSSVAHHCKQDTNSQVWSDNDAHGSANKTACELVAGGLYRISTILDTYNAISEKTPYDNQEFKQFVSCLALKAIVQKMKDESHICNIDEGIKVAFGAASQIKKDHCNNGKPCFLCKLDDSYDSCNIGNNSNVKTNLENLLKTKGSEVNNALKDITETPGNAGPSLCDRLQCLSSRVEALKGQPNSTNAKEFWTDKGEVADLWNTLSTAMKTNRSDEDKCKTMDDGTGASGTSGRTATDPEKKACNYLHAGLKELYKTNGAMATPSPSPSANGKLLDNPLLRQTVGCLLLHAYAKKMKEKSTCVIDSGIVKAFKAFDDNNASCTNNGSCIKCEWKETDYDNCQITTNGNSKEPAKNKLDQVKNKIDTTAKDNLKKINHMDKLCDYIKCAAPKWFYNQKNNKQAASSGTTKSWCEFWNEGVKPTLENMFKEIEVKGKTNTNYVTCQGFGDGNPHSVERKACIHIAEGLNYIKNIKPKGSGASGSTITSPNDKDKQLLDRAVACIALNMYADQIREKSKNKCPIDEKRIEKMFEVWNKINNYPCPTSGGNNCFECKRKENFNGCHLSVADALVEKNQSASCSSNDNRENVKTELNKFLNDKSKSIPQVKDTLSTITNMSNSFCTKMQCAAKQYYVKKNSPNGKSTDVKWEEINDVVKDELTKLIGHITNHGNWDSFSTHCNDPKWNNDTKGEITAKQKACKLFASGLKYISQINDDQQKDTVPLKRTMMCAALNLYADQLTNKSTEQCPLDGTKLEQAIKYAFEQYNATMRNGTPSQCSAVNGPNSCFICNREDKFHNCQIGSKATDKVKDNMDNLLDKEDQINSQPKSNTPTMEQTLDKINSKDTFCTQVQCAIKQHYAKKIKGKTFPNGTRPSWGEMKSEIERVLTDLLNYMEKSHNQSDAIEYCNDEVKWSKFGHKGKHTNKAACLLFASGLKHIYTHGNDHQTGQFKGPSFEQTMGCLFLKEYAKQLQKMAETKKKGQSWVHPLCDIDKGINHAFDKSGDIMKNVLTECNNGTDGISCFQCKLNEGYDNCKIGDDDVGNKAKDLFEGESKQNQMEKTLENTVCPILLTDLLTPFVPLAPVSIGLSAMAYYLWKYFGPLGKGGPRFRRSPAEIRGPSVQEQVLDHVQQDSSHEYRLVKERKPRSVPTRTKRSGPVNRRTIIEIHFEVLDECQKGDTQLNQKDFLELLVQEFMGSELMEEEEQVPKEDVLMEGVPMGRVPSLGSGFMV
ncbi:SICAvar, type I (fragment) [Plasmodium knowlesi strain H]|uniref:SICAvar, type I n=2 Tax=Plasmodium knowlesi (strain H) TaxID=5851 RepID=A0A1A7VW98_PLAKH